MSDTREKLIELLADYCPYKEKRCVGCDPGKHYHPECKAEQFGKVADHLIANGGRLETKQATSDESKRWVPVSEPPKKEFEEFTKGTDWDVYPCLTSVRKTDGGRYVTKLFYDGERFVNSEYVCYSSDVTHWMPLPEPPGDDVLDIEKIEVEL